MKKQPIVELQGRTAGHIHRCIVVQLDICLELVRALERGDCCRQLGDGGCDQVHATITRDTIGVTVVESDGPRTDRRLGGGG